MRALVEQLGVTAQVRFIGSRTQGQLPYLYSAADVVAVPSHYESFGLVALEAQACGTPVVASNVGGLRYTISDGSSGFLVPWDEPAAFAAQIKQLVQHEGLREEMGARAIANARAYAWPRIATRVLDLYQAVAHRRQAAPAIAPLHIPRCSF